jgi:hypothetical protein
MTKNSRKHAGNQRYQHQHQRQRRGPQGAATNTYFALTSGEQDGNGTAPSWDDKTLLTVRRRDECKSAREIQRLPP